MFSFYPQFNSSFIVWDENDPAHKIAFDCGYTFLQSLVSNNIDPNEITDIYISHCHSDHCGGLEQMGFHRYFTNMSLPIQELHKPKLRVIANADIIDSLTVILTPSMTKLKYKDVKLREFFDCEKVDAGGFAGCYPPDIRIYPVFSPHMVGKGLSYMPCYGASIIGKNAKRIFFTADCKFDPSYFQTYYESRDIIIHDCDFSDFMFGPHPPYSALKLLPDTIKSKIILTHHGLHLDTQEKQRELVCNDGFMDIAYPESEFSF
jgi:ribonuclease BN (tRNA processing enzyme)